MLKSGMTHNTLVEKDSMPYSWGFTWKPQAQRTAYPDRTFHMDLRRSFRQCASFQGCQKRERICWAFFYPQASSFCTKYSLQTFTICFCPSVLETDYVVPCPLTLYAKATSPGSPRSIQALPNTLLRRRLHTQCDRARDLLPNLEGPTINWEDQIMLLCLGGVQSQASERKPALANDRPPVRLYAKRLQHQISLTSIWNRLCCRP